MYLYVNLVHRQLHSTHVRVGVEQYLRMCVLLNAVALLLIVKFFGLSGQRPDLVGLSSEDTVSDHVLEALIVRD